jgi:hypothetical protein
MAGRLWWPRGGFPPAGFFHAPTRLTVGRRESFPAE